MRVLLALVSVLTCTTPAAADCAWVLWGQTVDPSNALATLPLGGWPSKSACEQERVKRAGSPELRMATYTCLPDTVDPRGADGEVNQPRWLVTCSCGWERECLSEWAARVVSKLHPRLAPMDVEHVTRIQGPDDSAGGRQLTLT